MFNIGDYVIADHCTTDTWDDTFVVVGFKLNMYGETLVKVRFLGADDTTVFYPHELSWEDGSRPSNL